VNRRSIIGLVALAVAGLIGVGALALLAGDDDRRIGAISSSSSGGWTLELDGSAVARLQSLEGCRPKGTVVELLSTGAQGNPVREKQLGNVAYEPCVMRFDTTADRPLFQWMKAVLDGSAQQRKTFALRHINPNTGKVTTEIAVQNGLISEIQFPKFENLIGGAIAVFELTVVPDQLTKADHGSSGPSG
jgi:T4-like virus tail tube protein gp19